ncbi:OLC1v1012421C1 [Oldenlandia corymbosa var. corymbosa]|uniref:OLC1v1012421C1 n=1 Tax=Oldenlandia corymbosa var. corymbosa TaxID=529605 RepID=A0AAV1DVY8_OLDCO|nr:OLC1v1012421C1 [Oldenlandia corymbosa var. corymbosa]
MSFKEKMLRGQRHRDCPMFETEDIEIEDLDQEVVLIKDGQMPRVVISDKHVLRDCLKAAVVWKALVPVAEWRAFNSPECKEWLMENFANWRGSGGENWPMLFGVTAWWIWRLRNMALFEGKEVSLWQSVKEITQKVSDVIEARKSLKMVGAKSVTREWRLLAWSPPPAEWIKLNIDGALNTDIGWATAGGLLRDCTGGWCGGFSINIGYCSITGIEIWGLLQGLQLAWDKGYRKLEAKVDNKIVVRLVLPKEPNSEVHLGILCAIKELMSRSWEVKLAHVHREKNFAADYMAALVVSNPPGLHKMDFPP